MDSNYNRSLGEPRDSDESSTISSGTCESTPLSPRKPNEDVVDIGDTKRGEVHFVYRPNQEERCKMATADLSKSTWSLKWKCWIILAFTVFTVVLLIGISFAMRTMQCEQNRQKQILDTYKDLFMTEKDMHVMMRKLKVQDSDMIKNAPVRDIPEFPEYNCTLIKREILYTDAPVDASTSSDRPLFHGCCETRFSMRTFDYLPDREGRIWRVIQFMDHFQYFFVDSCMHKMDCTLPCCCKTMPRAVHALVAHQDLSGEHLRTVVYPGVCKCVNTQPCDS